MHTVLQRDICRTLFRNTISQSVLNLFSTRSRSVRMPKPGFYAVKSGRTPGIYNTWSECELQVKNYKNASFKKFPTLQQAKEYLGIPSATETSKSNFGHTSATVQKPSTNSRHLPKEFLSVPSTNEFSNSDFGEASHSGLNPSTDSDFWCDEFDSDMNDLLTINMAMAADETNPELIYNVSLPKQSFYAVHRGARPGVYRTWTECEAQIRNTKNASYRKFDNEEQALEYVRTGGIVKATKRELQNISYDNKVVKKRKTSHDAEPEYVLKNPDEPVIIYTDGASSENGKRRARAGIGIYWGPNHPLNASKRLSGRQTNNRAEIQAAVYALNQAKQIGAKKVKIYTDSQFLIHSITDWIKKWKANGWKLVNGQDVINKDDFIELEAVSEGLDVEYVYVRAHARNHGNDEADRLAVAGAKLLLEPKNCSAFPKPESISSLQDKIEPFLITDLSSSSWQTQPLIIPEKEIVKKSFYAVHRGNNPGVYTTWTECEEQIKDFIKPWFKKFTDKEEALEFVKTGKVVAKIQIPDYNPNEFVSVYTDGASSCNGQECAKAGIGVYWGPGNKLNTSMRLPGRPTNNRAEIHAAVHALTQAKQLGIKNIRLYTDSKLVINGITSWIENWKANGWKTANGKPVINKEDFMTLDRARQGLNVDWCYVKGHDNNPGNVEADKLAVAGCSKAPHTTFVIA